MTENLTTLRDRAGPSPDIALCGDEDPRYFRSYALLKFG
jgi:hypothetical protein